jgi:putative sporulation protein YtaF
MADRREEERRVLDLLSLLVLGFAVSLDGFGVGITYGLRKIRIPWWSMFVIALCSATMIFISVQVGQMFSQFLSEKIASYFGAVILIGVGAFAIYNILNQKEQDPLSSQGATPAESGSATVPKTKTVLELELKKIGLVIQILRTPSSADVDRSGDISIKEALILGFALSMDGFGAGIGASLVGFHPLPTALTIAIMTLLFLYSGMRVGMRFADTGILRKMVYLPGIMLILIGISKFF